MSLGGSRPSGSTTTTTEPWAQQQPYLTSGFGNAQGLYENYTPSYYPGDTYADPNYYQAAGLSSIANTASGDTLPATAQYTNQAIARGDYFDLNPAASTFGNLAGDNSRSARTLEPYLSGQRLIDSGNSSSAQALGSYVSGSRLAAGNPYMDEVANSVIAKTVPGVQSQFIGSGMLSSPEAARATAEGVAAALAPYQFGQYQQEEQNQLNAAGQLTSMRQQDEQNQLNAAGQLSNTQLQAGAGQSNVFSGGVDDMLRAVGLAPSTDASIYEPGNQLLSAGSTAQGYEQSAIDDAVQRWNWEQQLPYAKLNEYLGAITGNYGSSTTTPYFSNPTANILGGLTSAATIGSLLLSDRRMKDDINVVGKLNNGLRVYSYRYKDDPEETRRIGLMADDVEKENPDAVVTIPFGSLAGFKAVDYARAVE